MMVPARVMGLLLCMQLCMGSEVLRLVDGGGRCAGREEVKHKGEWGSVCSYEYKWDAREAGVVCQQLGCGKVAHKSPYAPFGQGQGRIWLHPTFCDGTEATLQDCTHYGWGKHFCGHEWDVGVICTEALKLQLVDGRGPCEGRVEVKLRNLWGTVYDSAWNMNDAEVVCQQLGCGSAAHTTLTRRVSHVRSPVMLADIKCKGNEKAIWDCNIKAWGPYNVPHHYNATVVCQGFSRLAGGDSACSGRLEVRQGRAWVSVCHSHVDLMAAQVVCRELGCGTTLALPEAGHFGVAAGPFWDGAFECNGTQLLLSACTRRPPHMQNCTQPAAIICTPYTGFRLADGDSRCADRVEVEARGVWKPLCATAWDLPDAHVLCRHLGCGSAVSLSAPGHFGMGTGTLLHDALSCSGSERHPGECPVEVLGQPTCPLGHTAAINCSGGCGDCGEPQQVGSTAHSHGTTWLLQVSLSPCDSTVGRAGATDGWRWPRTQVSGTVCLCGCGTMALPPWCADSRTAVCLRKSMLCQTAARAPWSCRSCSAMAPRSSWHSVTPQGWPQSPATAMRS
ncbi:deleted in malignant brain tumors 1 protein-like [Numida meleagris]|uniref:deleted in malignant brain tumors 1 protein-like n=1 Tax=Numida meleagris TaxID=8996 RepID=UPI000B3DFD1B|nr:deleted in malignant brain tumors 1 protein-like [Numida meleagris]